MILSKREYAQKRGEITEQYVFALLRHKFIHIWPTSQLLVRYCDYTFASSLIAPDWTYLFKSDGTIVSIECKSTKEPFYRPIQGKAMLGISLRHLGNYRAFNRRTPTCLLFIDLQSGTMYLANLTELGEPDYETDASGIDMVYWYISKFARVGRLFDRCIELTTLPFYDETLSPNHIGTIDIATVHFIILRAAS